MNNYRNVSSQGKSAKYLNKLVVSWDKRSNQDKRDTYNYANILREVLFHADLRFAEYIQFENQEGPFVTRLCNWICNVATEREKQSLLKLASLIVFIDRGQMLSLYRDAYKRIIIPLVTEHFSSAELINDLFESKLRTELKKYRFYTITESFNSSEFINKDSLTDLVKFDVFSEDPSRAILRLPSISNRIEGLMILEDFVGTGKQSSEVLKAIIKVRPKLKLTFIPLIVLQEGYEFLLRHPDLSGVKVNPVLVIDRRSCLKAVPDANESEESPYIRAVVKSSANRVLASLNEHDDPPQNEFGFHGSGSLIVTYHNAPNNTLPLVHHRAPHWNPLFRRVHHSKDGL